jgi:hypothetical protein
MLFLIASASEQSFRPNSTEERKKAPNLDSPLWPYMVPYGFMVNDLERESPGLRYIKDAPCLFRRNSKGKDTGCILIGCVVDPDEDGVASDGDGSPELVSNVTNDSADVEPAAADPGPSDKDPTSSPPRKRARPSLDGAPPLPPSSSS